MSKIDDLIEVISNLNHDEVDELRSKLQDQFGLSLRVRRNPILLGKDRIFYSVILHALDDEKATMTCLRQLFPHLGASKAKEILSKVPYLLEHAVYLNEAERIKSKLKEVGAVVEIK